MKKKIDFKVKQYSKLPLTLKKQEGKITFDYFYKRLSKKKRIEAEDKYCSKPYKVFLAIEKKSIISIQKLYKRKIKYEGKQIVLGGVGGICTIKKRRKRGIARILLKKAMQEFRKENCDVAFLCTNIKDPKLVRLYNRIGFVIMKQQYTFLGKSGKKYREKNGMIALVKSKSKFNLILKSKEGIDIGYGGL